MSLEDPIGLDLPKRWRLTTLGQICDENGGEIQTGPFGSQLHAHDYVADGVPSVMPKDIINDAISLATIARVPEQDARRLSVHRLKPDDVIYARRGDIGRRALVTRAEEGWLCGTGCLRIRTNAASVLPTYLLAYLGHPILKDWVESKAQGATMLNLNTSILRAVPLRLPPIAEQRRIADVLDKADAIRRKRIESIALTEQLLRSTFLEMFGDPVSNPRGWEVKALGDVADVQGGLQVTHARADHPIEVPYLRVANVYRDRLDLTEIKTIRVTDAERDRARLLKGDVLVVEGHGNPDELGRSAVWQGALQTCLHQNHLIRVRTGATITPTYLSAFLNSASGRAQMLSAGKTTSGLNTISTSNVRHLRIMVPALATQRRYEAFAGSTRTAAEGMLDAMTISDALFSSLVDCAFSGRL